VNNFDVEQLLGSVINGALGGRRKRSRGARRYLTGGKRSFLSASTLMTLAGVAWGVWETANRPGAGSTAPAAGGPAPGTAPSRATSVPPPLPPTAPASGAQVVPPPLPGPAGASAAAPPPLPSAEVSPAVRRVLRLTLSAAHADGLLTEQERESILTQARAVGAESMVASELESPKALEEIVGGVEDAAMKRDLYTLAYTIVRADEAVTVQERDYLTKVAAQLDLSADECARLEQQAAERIQAAAEGAQD
jgi:Protein of unknown function (DUF533)